MSPSSEHDRMYKAARLAILLDLDAAGLLDGLTLDEIAALFPVKVNKSTISRDKRLLPQLRVMLEETRNHAKDKQRKSSRRSPRTRATSKSHA